eukprot:scaffold97074_cov28-Tisochrysis_lutea.AAC.3
MNITATPARRTNGGSECASHASGVGRQELAKWYSSAVSLCHVGHSAVSFTTPLINMNLTHWARMSHATAGSGRAAAPGSADPLSRLQDHTRGMLNVHGA